MNDRNSICPCGSGKKYKKCCLLKQQEIDNELNAQVDAWFEQDIIKGQQLLTECVYDKGDI